MASTDLKSTTVGPMTFDCTQREIVVDIANKIYRMMGYSASQYGTEYFFRSEHPTEQAVLAVAENIFEMFWGDSPEYDDDELEL